MEKNRFWNPVWVSPSLYLIQISWFLAVIATIFLYVHFIHTPHRIEKNERSAIAMLRRIAADEGCFKENRLSDVNGNRVGEYGFLSDLIRVRPLQLDPVTGEPAEQSMYCGVDCRDGILTCSGYHFLVYLPDEKGRGQVFVPEARLGRPIDASDASADEAGWCCYAWPEGYAMTGKRTFFINQAGEIHATDQKESVAGKTPYSAKDRIPDPEAAFVPETDVRVMMSTVADGQPAKDRETWTRVN